MPRSRRARVCLGLCGALLGSIARRELETTSVSVCTVVGFPTSAHHTSTKGAEARQAVQDGALELDMVINSGYLESDRVPEVPEDIRGVVEAAGNNDTDVCVKAILETGPLDDTETVIACECARIAGADFVKTSTGFFGHGATPDDVVLMRRVVGGSMGLKASGGIRTRQQAEELIARGATRIGASRSIDIIRGV